MHIRKLITLLTDFGLADSYVAEMKGVILSRCQNVSLIDITHQIPPYDITLAAMVLGQAYPAFPSGTIHLAVVDPGVGGPRKSLLLLADGHCFIGPDNGLFSLPALRDPHYKAFELIPLLKKVSPTFHGRDIFAPAAGELGRGKNPRQIGQPINSITCLEGLEPQRLAHQVWQGKVIKIDTFGNLVTNIPFIRLQDYREPLLTLKGKKITRILRTFCEGKKGELAGLENSYQLLEIVVPLGSAQAVLKAKAGDLVVLKESPHRKFPSA